jgi:hypothetical protein
MVPFGLYETRASRAREPPLIAAECGFATSSNGRGRRLARTANGASTNATYRLLAAEAMKPRSTKTEKAEGPQVIDSKAA